MNTAHRTAEEQRLHAAGDRSAYWKRWGPYLSERQVSVTNRGPKAAECHVLPSLWFRNTWSWEADSPKPRRPPRDRR